MAESSVAVRWADVAQADPALATAGLALLTQESGVAIGFLATVSPRGVPHLAPVCPILCGEDLYVSVGDHTPKRVDLDANGRYMLHAFLGANDAEFAVSGIALRIDEANARERVQAAIRFGAFGRDDPIYRLGIARCLYGYWENVGRPDTRPVRRWWRARREG